jgi:dipeptidyl aminopeptidase/acylaminoacyl peptidase
VARVAGPAGPGALGQRDEAPRAAGRIYAAAMSRTDAAPVVVPGRPGRPYLPSVVRRQVVLEEHDVSRDGRYAVVVRRSVHGNDYASQLWLVPLDGGRPWALTSGTVRDTHPRFRPDGRVIAFKRSKVGGSHPADHAHEGGRLLVLRLDASGRPDGDPAMILDGERSIGELAWSPDGRRLAFTAEVDPPRFLIGAGRPRGSGRDAATADERPLGRHIRRIDWRYGTGHVDRWEHLFVAAARKGARPRQLTHGDFGVGGIDWAPDGASIAYVADPRPDADLRPRNSIWRVAADGGEPTEVLALGGNAHSPAHSPDGRWLAAVGVVDADALDDVSPTLVVGPADASAPARALAPDLDRPVGAWHDSDLNGWMTSGQSKPVWADDATLVALVSDRGRTVPWRFRIDPASGRAAAPPEPLVAGASADAACWTVRSAGGRTTSLGLLGGRAQELLVVDESPDADGADGARLRPLTSLGSAWQRGLLVPEIRRLDAPGEGGPIETWVVSPPDAGDGPLPTVVDVHGGPLGAWAQTPSLEIFLLVSRGYRVVLPNIRGSATYGRDWIRPQLGDWGGVDAADVHAALDAVVATGLADPDRLGVLGLSYGGFMVHWLVGTTDRFKAAVSENGVVNQVGAWANSDTGPEYCRTSLLGDPFTPEGIEKLWRQSPLRLVSAIRTPLLMLQAEADRRCPQGDNEQLFIALRLLGRTVEYVLYPDEYHVYATTGRPDRRIDRMTRMLDWFDRFLEG